MTLWFCDRCGEQVKKDSYGAGKYGIEKMSTEVDETGGLYRFKRGIKLCDQCAMEMEKFLDDEFSKIPAVVNGTINKRA